MQVVQKTVEVPDKVADTTVVVQHQVPMAQKVRADEGKEEDHKIAKLLRFNTSKSGDERVNLEEFAVYHEGRIRPG